MCDAMEPPADLYEFPADYTGRKTYVSVQGHRKSVPKYKTYRGVDARNHLLPEYGGSMDGMGSQAAFYMPDKEGYRSPMDNQFVEGRAAHREHMRLHNVVEAGDMPFGYSNGVDRSPLGSSARDIVDVLQGRR